MKVLAVETSNFINIGQRTIRSFQTAIPDDVAVFVGGNGSGKSILLEQIAHSSQGSISGTLSQMREVMRSFESVNFFV